MLSVREKYWRYSLFVLIAGLGLTIFVELTPFLGGLLGAVTIYVLLRRQMWFLSERRRWRRSLAASLLLGEAIFFFLVPISLIVWMVVDKIQGWPSIRSRSSRPSGTSPDSSSRKPATTSGPRATCNRCWATFPGRGSGSWAAS